MNKINCASVQSQHTSMKLIGAGFSDPVFESHQVFKKVLDGMSSPGSIKSMSVKCESPDAIYQATATLCLTLFDSDTRIWLSHSDSELEKWLKFHCGCQIVKDENASKADFAIIAKNSTLPDLDMFSAGTPEGPDKSATIILEVKNLNEGTTYITAGPGIKEENQFSATGLDEKLLDHMRRNKAIFPMGTDVIITAAEKIVCLTRTTTTRSL